MSRYELARSWTYVMTGSKAFVIIAVILLTQPAIAEEAVAEHPPGTRTLGLIVNVPDLRFTQGTYQTGMGLKLRYPDSAFRGLASFRYDSAAGGTRTAFHLGYERPLLDGPLLPYWAVTAGAGLEHERIDVAPADYTRLRVFDMDLAVAFGVEVYLLEHVSVFAEYQVAAGLRRRSVIRSMDGSVTEATDLDFAVEARPGSAGALGFVVYLPPLPWDW